MNTQIPIPSVFLVFLATFTLCGSAQDNDAVRILTTGQTISPTALFKDAERRLAAGSFDTGAASLLKPADAFTKALIQVPDAVIDRYATYHGLDGDCLIVSWKFAAPAKMLILDDTPYQSIYLFRLPGARHLSAEDLLSFLKKVIAFEAPPLHLNPLGLTLSAGPASSTILFFSAEYVRSSYDLRNIFVSGGTDGLGWYLAVTVPKQEARSFYPPPLLIPERFPPLSELLKTWSLEHIWSEVGAHANTPLSELLANQRNHMLVAELARRGLSEQQFVDLLVSKDVASLRGRLTEVWWGFSEAHAENTYARYGAAALHSYARIGSRAEESADAYFAGACSPEFDSLAKVTLRERLYWTGPIDYISRCSNSLEDLRLLEGLDVPDRAQDPWRFSVASMRRRLDATHDGRIR
jgi:hypothetical protein